MDPLLVAIQAGATARVGRTGPYDVRVTNLDGEPVALFHGNPAAVKGHRAA